MSNNEKIKIKPGTLLYPLPAVMVTAGNSEKNNIITIAWTGIINSDPAILYISVRKSRYSHAMISENGEFVINLTTEKLARATDFAGVRSGRNIDKAGELGLTLIPGVTNDTPMIAESPINLECKVLSMRFPIPPDIIRSTPSSASFSFFFLRCNKNITPAAIVITGKITVMSCEFWNKLKAAPRFWTYVKSNTPRKTGSVSPISMRLLTANLVI